MVEMRGICKSFPGVSALKDVNLSVHKGEITSLIGENGAGKSTLMRLLSGADTPDTGEIFMDGKKVHIGNPIEAQQLGIFMVQQELSLIPSMQIVENIVLGREFKSKFGGVLRNKENLQQAQKALDMIGLKINPMIKVGSLDVATQQMIEIARNLVQHPKVLILDEPTAALSAPEIEHLLSILKSLKEKGVSIIFISHKLEEVLEITDTVTVLRDGQVVSTLSDSHSPDRQTLISMMVGRELDEQIPPRETSLVGSELLKVENISKNTKFQNVSFSLRAGEVVGVFGLKGAGRSDVAMAIFGAFPIDNGRMFLDGKKTFITSPINAISHGMGLLTEDRKSSGLFLNIPVKDNISIATIMNFSSKFGVINSKREREVGSEYINRLRIKTPSLQQKARFLSGGNQQKILLARWLLRESRILILDEPTKGIDIGAKHEVYLLIDELARMGKGILMISSEIEEILAIADTIVVMRTGTVSAILNREEASRELIMHYAAG